MKDKKREGEYIDLKFKCSCGCNGQVLVVEFLNGQIEINSRENGRKRWSGAVLSREDVKKLRNFINKFPITKE